jgi:hypothetical protein
MKENQMRTLLATAIVLSLGTGSVMAQSQTITADVWADNWFEMYVNGEKVLEDSVPITTERSFNAETASFEADMPMTIAIMAKDFKENDSGLEYIGTNRQQMGDGGLIAQFHDAAGALVAVTDGDTRCLVVHHAPLDVACAKESNPVAGEGACGFTETDIPSDWTAPGFDDSAWPAAVVHSAQEVSPKDGYDNIAWDSSAELIWGEDLHQDNTLICRITVGS